MRLEDLQRAQELAAALKRLDEFAGPAELAIGGDTLALSADETADFVERKRGRLHQQLRALGIVPEGEAGAPTITEQHNPREQKTAEGGDPAPLRPAAAGDRAEIERRVTAAIMADSDRLLATGVLDREAYDKRLEQRRPRILERVAELMRPAPAPAVCDFAGCELPATTVVDGRHVCAHHADPALTPRLELVR